MTNKPDIVVDSRVKTFRWLFYMSLFPIVCLLVIPAVMFHVPMKIMISLEILGALTVGVLFALFFLGVNICGLFMDKDRKPLYAILTVLMSVWVLWATISWAYIEHMDYLLR